MKSTMWKTGVLVAALLGVVTSDAVAWGPRAQRAISGTTIQIIRRTYPNAFKTNDSSYEDDVLRGAMAGPELLNKSKPFAREEDAVRAVDNEIRLLREVRQYGFGSYFSFRMGVLASLVADLILPYSLEASPQAASLQQQIESDIDAHLDSFSFAPGQASLAYMRDARAFLKERRAFLSDSKRLIADDYHRGKGYEGYLKEGAQAFFSRAVESVADAWHTVLRVAADPTDVPPSPAFVTTYLISEIQYLLDEKRNFYQATKAYENFAKAAGKAPGAYEQVGDLFYAFGTPEAVERGVREWRTAYDMPRADRRAIGKKLADHYIQVGNALLESASRPGASDQDLRNALNAFTQALQLDQTNDLAAEKINKTNVAINERNQRRDVNRNIIAAAEKVIVQAEKARLGSDFGLALTTYYQAMGLFQTINEEFTDQKTRANQGIKEINKNITDIINEVLDQATDTIDKGDKAVDERRFEEAVQLYERVPNVVSVIPGDESTTHGKDKAEMITLSKKKIDDAKLAKSRFEDAERQRKAAAEAAASKAAGR